MSKYRRLGLEHSGGDDFYSDANLPWEAASPMDYGVGPNENPADAGARAMPIAWALEDVEVDTGGRGASPDAAVFDAPAAPVPQGGVFPPISTVPEPDSASLDRLVDLLADKLMKRLGG